jgi:hypothetical protein
MTDIEKFHKAWLAVREAAYDILEWGPYSSTNEAADYILIVMDAELPEWAPAKPEEDTQ